MTALNIWEECSFTEAQGVSGVPTIVMENAIPNSV